jgi:hypothetical protein
MKPSDPFDPDNLRLNGSTLPPPEAPRRPGKSPRHRPGEWFLRGPVPWPWLEAAARLPGQALAVALCLWREVGRHKRRTVQLSLGRTGLGVSEQAARRALRAMELAGLVSVLRKPGRGLEVTLLDLAGVQRDDGGRQ